MPRRLCVRVTPGSKPDDDAGEAEPLLSSASVDIQDKPTSARVGNDEPRADDEGDEEDEDHDASGQASDASRGKSSGGAEYFLAGRRTSGFAVALSLVSGLMSGTCMTSLRSLVAVERKARTREARTCTQAHRHTRAHARTHAHTRAHTQMHTTHTHDTHTHTHTHDTHTHTHTYTHTYLIHNLLGISFLGGPGLSYTDGSAVLIGYCVAGVLGPPIAAHIVLPIWRDLELTTA
jgi:hypothetical protein